MNKYLQVNKDKQLKWNTFIDKVVILAGGERLEICRWNWM